MTTKKSYGLVSATSAAGAAIAGVSIFNLIRKGLSLGLHPVIADIVEAYEYIFHSVFFDFVFAWITVPIPSYIKDIFAVWLVGTSATIRVVNDLVRVIQRQRGNDSPPFVIAFLVRMSGLQRLLGLGDQDAKALWQKLTSKELLRRYGTTQRGQVASVWLFYVTICLTWPRAYYKLLRADVVRSLDSLSKRLRGATTTSSRSTPIVEDEDRRFPFLPETELGGVVTAKHTAFVLCVVVLLLLSNAGLPG